MDPIAANPDRHAQPIRLKPLLVPLGCLFLTLLLWNVRRLSLGELPSFPLDDPYITLHTLEHVTGLGITDAKVIFEAADPMRKLH